MKKGQGSTEYLVILGVVLVVALVVIGLMGWFPGMATTTREQQSTLYWQSTSPLAINSFKYNGTSVTFGLANRLGQRIVLRGILLNGANVTFNAVTFNPGQELTIFGNASASCGSPGYGTERTVVFYYDQGSNTGIRQTGDKPLVFKCS